LVMCISILIVLFFSAVQSAVDTSGAFMGFTHNRAIVEEHIEANMPSTFKEAYGNLLESQKMRFEDYVIVLGRGGRNDLIQALFETVLKEEQDRCANFVARTPNPPPADVSDLSRQTWILTNEVRTRQCLQPLNWNTQLATAAQQWSQQLVGVGKPVHCAEALTDAFVNCGDYIQRRVRGAGYQGDAGENVVAGTSTPDKALQYWWESKFHRRSLLKPTYTDYGAGVTFTPPGVQYGSYWVQNFGIPALGVSAVDGFDANEFATKSGQQQQPPTMVIVGAVVGAVLVVGVVVVIVVVLRKNRQKQVEQV